MVLTESLQSPSLNFKSLLNSKHGAYVLPIATTLLLLVVWELAVAFVWGGQSLFCLAPSVILSEIPQWGGAVARKRLDSPWLLRW